MIAEQAKHAYRQGRFNDVVSLLTNISAREYETRLIRLESLYHTGSGRRATDEALDALKETVEPSLRSRCHSVVAAQLWDEGNRVSAVAHSKEALRAAEQS